MPFVDLILRLLGENPRGYYPEDKWTMVLAILINNDHYFMPWILGGIPLLWLGIRKWRGKPLTTKMNIITVALAVILGCIGFFILDLLSELAFALSYRRMYGDLFN